ncbi:hypothetical protein QO034_18170 [Sedimentitalea sp. JM2-8]|uniref:Uncharacterized protein n=1 Tax=Sedimentitalea xiamensis TaxID=3050037 RepID=A0ABT7FIR0_9RHOB|nr:hypothetical protein [Sedimentitalea xiamensis]MDK3075019.1 hypothetical protein [Sedimentitalea xiamensis]
MTQALSAEEQSKDRYFQQLAKVAEEMVAEHGKDFAAGALVLAARWVAENRLGQAENLKH